MCGILGYVGDKLSAQPDFNDVLREATKTIQHRGPDHIGFFHNDRVFFGHTRLSVRDLSSNGNQPMVCEKTGVVLSYNGEIYNFIKLKEDLIKCGYTLKSCSDTEVILHAYVKYGLEVLNKINGMYAFSIYDPRIRKVFLVRDRFGVKPLYYFNQQGSLIFSSEVKAIKKVFNPSGINRQAMVEYWWYGNSLGNRTMQSQINRLLPGCYLEHDMVENSTKIHKYWSPARCINREKSFTDSFETAARKVRELLDNAVRGQLSSDVPVGIMLSGGIDSGAITSFASKYMEKIKTYTAIFDYDKGVNESKQAKLVATRCKTDHHEFRVSGREIPDLVREIVNWHDDPFADAANIPLYMISRHLKKEVSVVLQGDGGDELFGGYRRHKSLSNKAHLISSFLAKPLFSMLSKANKTRQASRYLEALSYKGLGKKFGYLLTCETDRNSPLNIFTEKYKEIMSSLVFYEEYIKVIETTKEQQSKTQKMLHCDAQIILPCTFLEKVDKSTMANGVEIRVPFLDYDLAEYAISLPARYKVTKRTSKRILKESLRGIVPDEILFGKKQGFGVPYGHWLKTSLRGTFLESLDYIENNYSDVFDIKTIKNMYSDHISSRKNNEFILWKFLIFSLWLEKTKVDLWIF